MRRGFPRTDAFTRSDGIPAVSWETISTSVAPAVRVHASRHFSSDPWSLTKCLRSGSYCVDIDTGTQITPRRSASKSAGEAAEVAARANLEIRGQLCEQCERDDLPAREVEEAHAAVSRGSLRCTVGRGRGGDQEQCGDDLRQDGFQAAAPGHGIES